MVTILREAYDRLRADAEDLADLQTFHRDRAALAAGQEELIPASFANRLLQGESPLRVYRNLRGLTQVTLAEPSGVNRGTVAEIKTGRKRGPITSLRAFAEALRVTLDDLVEHA